MKVYFSKYIFNELRAQIYVNAIRLPLKNTVLGLTGIIKDQPGHRKHWMDGTKYSWVFFWANWCVVTTHNRLMTFKQCARVCTTNELIM